MEKIALQGKDFTEGKEEGKDEWELTLGADPEFELLKNGKIISIREDGHTEIRESLTSQIGTDGCGAQLELRPHPSKTEDELIENIATLIKKIKHLHLSSKGDILSLGGHVHFGIKNKCGKKLSVDGYRKLAKILDYYIGEFSLKANGKARKRDGYGFLSDIRLQPHGFEYRTPPAAIFSSPAICKTALKICRMIVEKAIIEGKAFNLTKKGVIKRLVELGLSSKEAKEFGKFLYKAGRSTTYKDNISEIWTDKDAEIKFLGAKPIHEPKIKVRIEIGFRDTWTIRAKRSIMDAVSDMKFKSKHSVILYGISEDEGSVFAGMDVPRYRGIDHVGRYAGSESAKEIVIGFPYSVRTGEEISPTIIQCLKNKITEVCNKKETSNDSRSRQRSDRVRTIPI